MDKLYKLTNRQGRTYNNTQWGEGVTHYASGEGDLCGPGWLHAYTDPLLAVLLNPIHANIEDPILWECEGEVGKTDHGLKVGCKWLTTIKQIPLPQITTKQRVKFAILCALEVYDDQKFVTWAKRWISGENRCWEAAAEAAALAARAAIRAARATEAATWAAARTAWVAAEAAARATWATTWATTRAAAEAAAEAAALAATEVDINLIALARKVCGEG